MKTDCEILKSIWQVLKLMRYRRKIRRFADRIWKLQIIAPNVKVENKLQDARAACYDIIDSLTVNVGLIEQTKEVV